MTELNFTLLTDGSSDRTLMNIVKWALNHQYPTLPTNGQYADFRQIKNPPKLGDISGRVKYAQEYYPYDILIYHRDAENCNKDIVQSRIDEIISQLHAQDASNTVCIIPVIMMESWLLFDEEAIKKASGNRNYNGNMDLPNINRLENFKGSKKFLHDLLKEASGLKNRNLKNFNTHAAVHYIAENIQDFTPLQQLPSFQKFENDLKNVVDVLLQPKG